MEQETSQIVPVAAPKMVIGWQTVGIVAGLVLLFGLLSYYLYRFMSHTNKRFKAVEQAIHSLSEQTKQHPPLQQQAAPIFIPQQQPKPVSVPVPVPIKPQAVQIQIPVPVPVAPPTPVVVADSKSLDKELMEELKELKEVVEPEPVPATEGRVE